MPKKQRFIKHSSHFSRALVATALLSNGVFQFVAPVLAEGTAAGQSISNTATATYEDPNNPNVPINSTSNTVTVTVAEVTGISVTPAGIEDSTAGTSPQVGDVLTYKFAVINVGNDPTKFNIPTAVTLTQSTAGAGTVGTIEYSIDGGQTWISATSVPVTNDPVPVHTPGVKIGSTTVDVGTVLVRVPVTINPAATPGTTIEVKLGNTPDPNTQNQPSSVSTPAEELSTKDLDDSDTNDVDGVPVGGEKEASAKQTETIGTKNYALATLKKTQTNYSNNSTPSVITDDTITYGLSLKVENSDPTGKNITPSALKGSPISVDSVPSESRILISDAIPAGTELDLSTVPTAPNANWEPVYTTSLVTTDANAAQWKRFNSGALQASDTVADVTRVGFINTNAITSLPANGTDITGFSIKVKVKSTATAPLTVANIAQLFGSTDGNNLPVYDESGDNNPSNYNPGTSTFPGTDSNGDGVPDTIAAGDVEDGYIDDSTDLTNTGSEPTNNGNDGSGPLGEANVLTINTSSLLNGPNGQPGALGPTNDNNTDFTNKSSAVPANTKPGNTIDPSVVSFTNTVQNGGSSSASIVLVPTPPATATDLRTGTTVTITDPNNASNTATYTYDSSGTGSFTLTSGTSVTLTVAANSITNYTVSVDLPTTTPLSTDTEKGYSVPITAFVDADSDKTLDAGEMTNITIDRVYTGFLKLVKFSRILQGTGPAVGASQGDFESTPAANGYDPNTSVTDVPRTPAPGNIIEYQIRYKNIASEDNVSGTSSNNVVLNVNSLVITESGILGTNSNWALDNDINGIIDTSNIVGSAVDSVPASATITYFKGAAGTASTGDQTGTTQDTDVTKYVNSINVQIAPGVQRTFTFQRKVN
ncbi:MULTISPECIES: beta strand repeat-containing protein [Calothrix]|uniref:DUF7925 domain-containing protein n=2 Tax=Calothrix TaxID=1186 RepID=A0ABR8A491_9CYAN|nr:MULTISPECIES: hypothetical protein [Calothrix]MBD2194168.1 hypothetical protein [Calothrix parietina FACHB-288]MBD2224964.1 hypothetical protein [Calothrix anomala FACHB-343]